jgi:hypothetical protein
MFTTRLSWLAIVACLAGLAAAQTPVGKDRSFRLKPAVLRDAVRVPLALRFAITPKGLPAVAGRSVPVQITDKQLQLDLDGDGRFEKRIAAKKPKVIEVSSTSKDGKATVRQLLVAHAQTGWWATSASLLKGKQGGTEVLLLDADLDGGFAGQNDWLAFGEGSLHRVEPALRLVADGDFLGSYELITMARSARLVVQPLGQGKDANRLQWLALLVTNEFRTSVGLPPTRLDPVRCDGCQKHALYLQLNNYDYSKPWDGVGSHDEVPGNPGYTKEGHRAAKRHATSGTPDAALGIREQTGSMLHRLSYLGAATGGLGVGAIAGANNSSAAGYSVVGGPTASPKNLSEVVVVPAPGQRNVPSRIKTERPNVEDDPSFYRRARGYPISVTWGSLGVTQSSLQLFDGRGKRVSGRCFTPEKAVHSTRPSNGSSAFFVTDQPLQSSTDYTVEFTATERGKPIRWRWTFATSK